MKIKQIAEDFFVKEIMNLELSKGDYNYFILKKKNWTTLEAIESIANLLNINNKRIGYAGNKDKRAITEQYISFCKIKKERVEELLIKDINFEYIGSGNKRINLGDLEGNFFRIVVRYLKKRKKLKLSEIKNYFDEQRFGINNSNYLIGKCLLKKDFKKACELLNLNIINKDYVNLLRKINKKLLRFYIHSYQSWLWNKVVSKLKGSYELVPIIGFLTEFKDKELKLIYNNILIKERINKNDFIIRQFPELSSEGSKRKMFIDIKNFTYKYLDDELNKGSLKAVVEFYLPKGSYASLVVKKLFK